MKQSKRQQRLEAKKFISITNSYEEMYPKIAEWKKNGVEKNYVVLDEYPNSDMTINKAREILKKYASDEWDMLYHVDEFSDTSMIELINLYEQNKFYYGFSKYESREGLKEGYPEDELIKGWMISNFKNQEKLSSDMGKLQQGHLFAIIESYLLMGDKFAKIALQNFKFQ